MCQRVRRCYRPCAYREDDIGYFFFFFRCLWSGQVTRSSSSYVRSIDVYRRPSAYHPAVNDRRRRCARDDTDRADNDDVIMSVVG